jgi:hypothetical protein
LTRGLVGRIIDRMKRTRWGFVAVAAAVVALVAPAVGQGKAESGSLGWSRSRGGAVVKSSDFGAVGAGARVSRWFRLGSSSLTKSRKLAIRLTGSPAFSITSDRCTGKSIGRELSCWVGLAYCPIGAPSSDSSATLMATDMHGRVASLSLSGGNTGPSGRLYWTAYSDDPFGKWPANPTVDAVPLGGGCVTRLWDGGDFLAAAADSTHVYWANGYAVDERRFADGNVTALATGQSDPFAIAVDGTHLYSADGKDGTVNEVPLGGGPVTTLATSQYPYAIAVDGTNVYWVDRRDGTVNEVPIGGGPVTTLATGQDDPFALAADGTYVYWVSYRGGTVNKVPVAGGSVTTLATGQYRPTSVAVEGANVYWVDSGDWGAGIMGTVNTIPRDGGTVTTLASGVAPWSVAVDSAYVYWTDGSDVNKVPIGGGPVTTLATNQYLATGLVVGP